MTHSNPEGFPGSDADALLRAITNLRERMRSLETETDNLRATVRYLHQQNDRDPLAAVPGASVPDESLLNRIRALEARSADQAEATQQLFTVLARTDANLQRLSVELERLLKQPLNQPMGTPTTQVAEIATPQRNGSEAIVLPAANPELFPPAPSDDFETLEQDDDPALRGGWKASLAVIVVVFCVLIGAVLVIRSARKNGSLASAASAGFSPTGRALIYENEKKYGEAEAVYRDLLKRDPQNADAIRHLASVLFRENKIEESSVVLKQLAVSGSNQ